jgi:hypothetical protein
MLGSVLPQQTVGSVDLRLIIATTTREGKPITAKQTEISLKANVPPPYQRIQVASWEPADKHREGKFGKLSFQ